jgi:hypothetical protein
MFHHWLLRPLVGWLVRGGRQQLARRICRACHADLLLIPVPVECSSKRRASR